MQVRLSQFYWTVGDMDQAEAISQQLLASNSQDPGTWYLLARIMVRQGRCAEAVLPARSAVDLDSDRADFWHILGDAYWCMGDKATAAEIYRQVVTLAPRYMNDLVDRLNPQ